MRDGRSLTGGDWLVTDSISYPSGWGRRRGEGGVTNQAAKATGHRILRLFDLLSGKLLAESKARSRV